MGTGGIWQGLPCAGHSWCPQQTHHRPLPNQAAKLVPLGELKEGKNPCRHKKEKKVKRAVQASEEVRRCSRHQSTRSPQGRAPAGAEDEQRRKEWQEGTAAHPRILPVHVKIQLSSHNLWFLTIPVCLFCPCDFEMGSLGEQISWEVSILTGCFPG